MAQETKRGGNRPKPIKIPGAPRRTPGRKQEIKQQGNKFKFQFKRSDYEDMEFDSMQEAQEYARNIRLASVKGAPLKVRRG